METSHRRYPSPPHRDCWTWHVSLSLHSRPILTRLLIACIGGVAHLVLTTDPTAPAPPAIVVPLALAGYSLPLCTNVIVTGLIVYHIWHYSYNLPSSPVFVGHSAARRAMTLVIESGLLYLLTQLVYVTLFALQHPAMGIIAVMAVQIYVRLPLSFFFLAILICTCTPGHCTNLDQYSRCAWSFLRKLL